MLKKSVLAMGAAAMLIGGQTSLAFAFPQPGTPTATWNLKNNSAGRIKLYHTNCGADTNNFPSYINPNSSRSVDSRSNNTGVYACRISYQLDEIGGDECVFTVTRIANVNPVTGRDWTWGFPTVMFGNSSHCSGRVVSADTNANGDFSVEVTYTLN